MREQGSIHDLDDYLQTRNFAALDGLRAVAVFLVFGFHFGGPSWDKFSGWLGVHAFFVLSGFLITTLLLRERDATGTVSLRAFYIRRAARILPLYFLVYLLVLGLSFVAQGAAWQQMKAATPYYLTLLNELADFAPLQMTWTLGVEWKYYLLWPAVFALFGSTCASRFGTAACGLALLAAVWMTGAHPSWFSPWHYLGMLVGSMVAIAMHSRRTFGWMRIFMTQAAALAVALALVAVHRKSLAISAWIGQPQLIAIYVLLVGMLLPALVANTWLRRVLSSRFLLFVGRRSYAMYLVQYLAAQAVIGMSPATVAGPLLLFASFGVALVASDFLYRRFEKPITDWGQQRARATGQQARALPAAPGGAASA